MPHSYTHIEHSIAARAYDQPLGERGAAHRPRTRGGAAESHIDRHCLRWEEHRAVHRRAAGEGAVPSAARDGPDDFRRHHQLTDRDELGRGELRVHARPRASPHPYAFFPTCQTAALTPPYHNLRLRFLARLICPFGVSFF